MKRVLLVGPSGVGKSYCVKALASKYDTIDMDLRINTCREYPEGYLLGLLDGLGSQLVAVSVHRGVLRDLLARKRANSLPQNGAGASDTIVYLRIADENAHYERLREPPTLGDRRDEQHIHHVIRSAGEIHAMCMAIADVVLDVTNVDKSEMVARIEGLLAECPDAGASLSYLTRERFGEIAKRIGGPHWKSPGGRWGYHSLAIDWAREVAPSSPSRVLEMGTMGASLVHGSDTVDYDPSKNNKDWCVDGERPTVIHDARQTPWPFADKQYELFVALRVFHHLVPVQELCFRETMRVSRAAIVVVPSRDIHPRGIDLDDFVKWSGVEPARVFRLAGRAGTCYLWKWS